LTPLEVPPLDLVLVNQGFAVSAAEGYANLVGFTPRLRFERALERLAGGEEPGWPNALQPGVLRLRPELRGVLTRLRESGLRGALMSGSGPTCFGVAQDAEHAASVAERLRAAEPTWWVRADTTL
jgi:4-diphosphocytidyl-2-C-methyl-D-erythritol kinase